MEKLGDYELLIANRECQRLSSSPEYYRSFLGESLSGRAPLFYYAAVSILSNAKSTSAQLYVLNLLNPAYEKEPFPAEMV